jgi:hypothetical protein
MRPSLLLDLPWTRQTLGEGRVRGIGAWITSLAVIAYSGLFATAAQAGGSPALCPAPPAAYVYLASADGSTDWLTTEPQSAEPQGYCQHCYCAEWSEGYYDQECLYYYCNIGCAVVSRGDPYVYAACMVACRPACYVSPQCTRVECENLGDTCVDP